MYRLYRQITSKKLGGFPAQTGYLRIQTAEIVGQIIDTKRDSNRSPTDGLPGAVHDCSNDKIVLGR